MSPAEGARRWPNPTVGEPPGSVKPPPPVRPLLLCCRNAVAGEAAGDQGILKAESAESAPLTMGEAGG